MRHVARIVLVVGLALAVHGAHGADEAGDAQAVVDQAITALGGADNLAKYKGVTYKENGTFYGMGDGVPYTGLYSSQLPKQFRMEIKDVFIHVVNGDEGWSKDMTGNISDMSKELLQEYREMNHAGLLVSNPTVLKDKAYHLSAPKADKVGDRPAVTITVSRKGYRDVTISFDKESHLPIRSVQMVKPMGQGDKEVKQEALFSDYKEFQGLKMPTKIVIHQDGKKFVESTLEDVKLHEKLDDRTFAKPDK
jgi:hypothetical protein